MLVGRRGFLVSLLAAPAVLALPVPFKIDIAPHLWGDGVHDDIEALQWLADRAGKDGTKFHLKGGTFLISKTLHLRGADNTIEDCVILFNEKTDWGFLHVHGPGNTVIRTNYLRSVGNGWSEAGSLRTSNPETLTGHSGVYHQNVAVKS